MKVHRTTISRILASAHEKIADAFVNIKPVKIDGGCCKIMGEKMKIEVLGMGCQKCKVLYNNALSAVKDAGIEAEVVKVEDMDIIVDYEVMTTPALVVNGEVKAAGKVSTVDEIKEYIS